VPSTMGGGEGRGDARHQAGAGMWPRGPKKTKEQLETIKQNSHNITGLHMHSQLFIVSLHPFPSTWLPDQTFLSSL